MPLPLSLPWELHAGMWLLGFAASLWSCFLQETSREVLLAFSLRRLGLPVQLMLPESLK